MHRITLPRDGQPYRTATGQTGRSAYLYELTAIANARRELDERMSTLIDIITNELPEEFTTTRSIATPQFPGAVLDCDREGAIKMLDMMRNSDSFSTGEAIDIINRSNLKGD